MPNPYPHDPELVEAQRKHMQARRRTGPNLLDIAERVLRERGDTASKAGTMKKAGGKSMWDTLLGRGASAKVPPVTPAKPARRMKSKAEVDAIVLNAENAVRRARENRRKRGRSNPERMY